MKIMKFLQRKLQRKLDDGRLTVEEALAKAPADNRTLKEMYGTVKHYLWTLTVEELRPKAPPAMIGNLSGRYKARLIHEITDEFTGEFQSTVNVIWDEYVRRVGIAAAYTALQEMLAQEPDEALTRSFLYRETKDFKEFWDVFDQEVVRFKDKFKQENKDSKLPLAIFAFGKFFDGYSVSGYHFGYDLIDIIKHYNKRLYYPIPLILKAVREEINRRYTSQLILEPALKLLDEVETHVNNQLQLRQKLF